MLWLAAVWTTLGFFEDKWLLRFSVSGRAAVMAGGKFLKYFLLSYLGEQQLSPALGVEGVAFLFENTLFID